MYAIHIRTSALLAAHSGSHKLITRRGETFNELFYESASPAGGGSRCARLRCRGEKSVADVGCLQRRFTVFFFLKGKRIRRELEGLREFIVLLVNSFRMQQSLLDTLGPQARGRLGVC